MRVELTVMCGWRKTSLRSRLRDPRKRAHAMMPSHIWRVLGRAFTQVPRVLLAMQVFDFSRDEMTSAKAKKLKESFNADFSLIFQVRGILQQRKPQLDVLRLPNLKSAPCA